MRRLITGVTLLLTVALVLAILLWPEGPDQQASAVGQPETPNETITAVVPAPVTGEVVVADPPPEWEKGDALEAAVAQAMAEFPGEYSVLVHDLGSGQGISLNPERRYHPASTIKLPVALYTLEQYRAGRVDWQDLIEYTPADFESPGGGAFESIPFGGLYPIENLVNRALMYSNNVAVNMLGRYFGWANIEAWTTTIDGEMTRVDGNPEVTVISELGWWLHLYDLAQSDPEHARLLLDPLGQVEYDGRITAGLPADTPHLHKFGSYDGNYHDGGIVLTKNPYIIIVMTYGAELWEADEAIAQVSAAVFQVMTD